MKYIATKKQYNDWLQIIIYKQYTYKNITKEKYIDSVSLYGSNDYDLYKNKFLKKYNIDIDKI